MESEIADETDFISRTDLFIGSDLDLILRESRRGKEDGKGEK